MATVVPCASCYAQSSVQPLRLFGKGPGGGYLSLITYRGPRCAPRPRLVCHSPKMTLRQICRMLKVMKQLRAREAAMAVNRKQGLAAPVPASPAARPEKRCLPACAKRRRGNNVKRAG